LIIINERKQDGVSLVRLTLKERQEEPRYSFLTNANLNFRPTSTS